MIRCFKLPFISLRMGEFFPTMGKFPFSRQVAVGAGCENSCFYFKVIWKQLKNRNQWILSLSLSQLLQPIFPVTFHPSPFSTTATPFFHLLLQKKFLEIFILVFKRLPKLIQYIPFNSKSLLMSGVLCSFLPSVSFVSTHVIFSSQNLENNILLFENWTIHMLMSWWISLW